MTGQCMRAFVKIVICLPVYPWACKHSTMIIVLNWTMRPWDQYLWNQNLVCYEASWQKINWESWGSYQNLPLSLCRAYAWHLSSIISQALVKVREHQGGSKCHSCRHCLKGQECVKQHLNCFTIRFFIIKSFFFFKSIPYLLHSCIKEGTNSDAWHNKQSKWRRFNLDCSFSELRVKCLVDICCIL